MGGMSSQVLWKQKWNADAESTLKKALSAKGCSVRDLSTQKYDAKSRTIDGVRDYIASYLAPAADAWSSAMLHLNALVGESLAAELSRSISGPAITILEYDQTTWGYTLFANGNLLDDFWSMPEALDLPPEQHRGNVDVVSSTFAVPRESTAPYIRHVTEIEEDWKAFADDEFALSDHWVRVDFMRRLGLMYPAPGQTPGSKYIKIDEPRTR